MPKRKRNFKYEKKTKYWWVFNWKKNPLILPPEFSKLPEPRKNKKDEITQDDNIDLTKVLETNDGSDEQTLPSDLEKSIQNILKKRWFFQKI